MTWQESTDYIKLILTKEKLSGNPAGVITNADGLSSGEMQRIARELNNSETAFIFKQQTL
ncbi:hypothetical protein UP17_21385 [Peribacillus simplex]|nr:hypothetical protein UP17_21385 [Peribacillus simplex]